MSKLGNIVSILFLVFLAQSFMGQKCLQAQTIPFDQDCRDVNGDLIPDCTCTNINGDIVSCTDGTILIPGGNTGGGNGGAGTNPGNDGIDNDGDGLIDEPDEAFWNPNQIFGRSGANNYSHPPSVPYCLYVNLNPNKINYNYDKLSNPGFEIIVHYIWTYEGIFKPDDVINLRIVRRRDGLLLEKGIHYERTFDVHSNIAKIFVRLEPKAYDGYEEYDVSISVNGDFKETRILILNREKSKSPKFGPIKRYKTYSRVLGD